VRVSRSCRALARAGITTRLAYRHLRETHRVLARAGSAAPGRPVGLIRAGSTGLTRAGRVR
jgi:hypothetical protein